MQKPEPELTQMPWHVRQKIVDKVDTKSKLSVAQVSKDLQFRVSQSQMDYEALQIHLIPDMIIVRVVVRDRDNDCWKKRWIEFRPHEKGAMKRNLSNDWEQLLEGEDYREAAIHYALGIFQNSKVNVRTFELGVDRTAHGALNDPKDPEDNSYPLSYPKAKFEEDRKVITKEILKTLKTYDFPLSIGKFYCRFQIPEDQLVMVLVQIDPDSLKTINLDFQFPRRDAPDAPKPVLTTETFLKMAHWKTVTRMRLQDYTCEVALEEWEHFKTMEMAWNEPMATGKQILMCFLRHPNFNHLSIVSQEYIDFSDIDPYMETLDVGVNPRARDGDHVLHASYIKQPSEPNARVGFLITADDDEGYRIELYRERLRRIRNGVVIGPP